MRLDFLIFYIDPWLSIEFTPVNMETVNYNNICVYIREIIFNIENIRELCRKCVARIFGFCLFLSMHNVEKVKMSKVHYPGKTMFYVAFLLFFGCLHTSTYQAIDLAPELK